MSYAIPAKYRGTCPRCGRPIDRGDWITREDKRWGHEDCEQAREMAEYLEAVDALLAADPSLGDEAYERVSAAFAAAEAADVDAAISELLAGT